MGSVLGRASPANAPPHSAVLAPTKEEESAKVVDYTNLPCPAPYRDLHLEATLVLVPPSQFEGLWVDLVNNLNKRFRLGHTFHLGYVDVFCARARQITKIASRDYEFAAILRDPKLLIAGKIHKNGLLEAAVEYDLNSNISCKIYPKLTNVPHHSEGTFRFDYKGKDYRSQFYFITHGFYGANYIQSVTPNLSLGTEVHWLGDESKSVIGFAARYEAGKWIASARIRSNREFVASYIQNISDKVSLASEFKYSHDTRQVTSSFGYRYKFKQSKLWAKVDCHAVVSAYLERSIAAGTRFFLSGEIDHVRKNHKFGYGLKFVSTPKNTSCHPR